MILGKDKTAWESGKGFATAREICQQPATWLETIAQVEKAKEEIQTFINQVVKQDDFDIIFTGAGTSEFVGNVLFSYMNAKYKFKVKSYATTDLVATPECYLSKTKPTLLISFGRSGNSPESIGAVDVADAVCQNVYHLFITCNHEGALSKTAQNRKNAYALNLTPKTHDQGFAMTSSYSNMMLAACLSLTLDSLNETKKDLEFVITSAENYLNNNYVFANKIVEDYDFDRLVYLGNNSLKGIAQESSLKMLELTAGDVVTMFDTPLGFRHGPKSIINDSTLTIIYLSDLEYTRRYELDLLKEMHAQKKGNKIAVISNKECEEAKGLADYFYAFNIGKNVENVLLAFDYILFAQTLALFKSDSMGITPDNPCPSGEVNRVVKGVTLYPYK